MSERVIQYPLPSPDRYTPLNDLLALQHKARLLSEKPFTEVTDNDCFELLSDITTVLEGEYFTGYYPDSSEEYAFWRYEAVARDSGQPFTIRRYEEGLYLNEKDEMVPLSGNDERIDLDLPVPDTVMFVQAYHEANYTFTRTLGTVIGRVDAFESQHFLSEPILPKEKSYIIKSLASTLT